MQNLKSKVDQLVKSVAGLRAQIKDELTDNIRNECDGLQKTLELAKSLLEKKDKHPDEKEDTKLINNIVDREMDEHNQKMHSGQDAKKSDELDAKIKSKMKAEMDKRGFGEADATRHIIDRDKGNKPKETPLMQSVDKTELYKALLEKGLRESALLLKNWGELDKSAADIAEQMGKSNEIKPFKQNIYDEKANIKRKQTRTGEEVEGAGKNVGVRRYTTSGSSVQAAHEAAEAKRQKKKTKESTRTLKDFSPEEIKAMEEKYNKSEDGMDKVDYSKFPKSTPPKAKPGKALDYSSMNKPQNTEDSAPTINYGEMNKPAPPKAKPGKALDYGSMAEKNPSQPKPKSWDDAREKTRAAREEIDRKAGMTAHETFQEQKKMRAKYGLKR